MSDSRTDTRKDGIHLRAIIGVGAAIALTIVLVGAAAYWVWESDLPPPMRDAPNTRLDFHAQAPLLDSAPQPNRAAYEAEKQQLLNGWQWSDRSAGIARIPIAQAMQLMAQQHAADPDRTDKRRPQ